MRLKSFFELHFIKQKLKKVIVFKLLPLVFSLVSSLTYADCSASLKELFIESETPSSNDLQKLQNVCSGSGIYEAALANSLLNEKDFLQAQDVLATALVQKGPYRERLLRLSVDANYFESLTKADVPRDEWIAIRNRYERLVKDHGIRDDYIIFLRISEISTLIEDYEHALINIKTGLNVEANSRFYSLLVIYMSSQGYLSAMKEAFEQAYQLNPEVFKEVDTMTFLSRGYSDAGEFKLAQNSLIKLVQENPSAEYRREFAIAVGYLEKALHASKND